MKRTCYFIFSFILPGLLLHAQEEYEYTPFPDSNAIWSEYYEPPYGSDEEPSYHALALFNEDTVINSITYRKLFRLYDTVLNRDKAEYIGGIREDSSKRVYYKGEVFKWLLPSDNILNENGEVLLYDFSLEEGDTLYNGNFALQDDFLVVKGIDTLSINGGFNKQYHFQYGAMQQWIEGIGNIRGLLFTTGDIPSNGLFNTLVCFKHQGNRVYFNENFDSCFPENLVNSTGKTEQRSIRVFPNPASEKLVFDKLGGYDNLLIYNLQGKLDDNRKVVRKRKIMLSTSGYSPGLYFYRLTGNSGRVTTGKFIVQ